MRWRSFQMVWHVNLQFKNEIPFSLGVAETYTYMIKIYYGDGHDLTSVVHVVWQDPRWRGYVQLTTTWQFRYKLSIAKDHCHWCSPVVFMYIHLQHSCRVKPSNAVLYEVQNIPESKIPIWNINRYIFLPPSSHSFQCHCSVGLVSDFRITKRT